MRFSKIFSFVLIGAASLAFARPIPLSEEELILRNDGDASVFEGREITLEEIGARDAAFAAVSGDSLEARDISDEEIYRLALRHLLSKRDFSDEIEARGVIGVAKMVIEGVMKVVELIKGKIKEDKEHRGKYTIDMVNRLRKEDPSSNYVICDTKYSFDPKGGKENKDWFHHVAKFKDSFGKKVRYDILKFHKGKFTRKGDGGWLNWAYIGNVAHTSKGGKVVEFN
ncbi:hypothetical protein DFP72DRAFT_1044866 [Ephemerocybe angulata]|uniref:Uncharacterized protein n=1 Tax=Ephemerocybe angulata TaxID=980116 RepID=A0A8H6I108_9AGAR|nr:hypothetical protein DFP72DRAFT_1044866 [Tulosesus angulatus]